MNKRRQAQGFTHLLVLLIVLVVAATGFGGWYVWQKNNANAPAKKTTTTATHKGTTQKQEPSTVADPYAGWKTYTDTSSGISVKYPSDWQIASDGSAFAWEIQHPTPPAASINVRFVFLNSSKTAQQEWEDCANPDACGPAPGETKLESTVSSTNGLDTYAVKMQGSTGVYYATVIKGTKVTASGVPFVEFLLNKPDATTLSAYKQILSTAAFSN